MVLDDVFIPGGGDVASVSETMMTVFSAEIQPKVCSILSDKGVGASPSPAGIFSNASFPDKDPAGLLSDDTSISNSPAQIDFFSFVIILKICWCDFLKSSGGYLVILLFSPYHYPGPAGQRHGQNGNTSPQLQIHLAAPPHRSWSPSRSRERRVQALKVQQARPSRPVSVPTKDHHPDHCAYSPAFHIRCTQIRSDPVIDLLFPVNASPSNTRIPFTIQASVKKIDYKSQTISISNLQSCLPPHSSVPQNTTASTFRLLLTDHNRAGSTLFNCSSDKEKMLSYAMYPITCLGGAGYQVHAVNGDWKVSDLPLTACSGMYSISYAPIAVLAQNRYSFKLEFGWSEPVACRVCEVRGK
ncbi:hypothetical protein RJ639_004722 [Escallonia herrerae]|uniref:RING-type E3 ubiquitin transferase n=1 Tax=Escallonia herrerae TaxID=1293975 RepID=A0AA88W3R8_9ASTE|nr:hypothetical protein RJ639_004722 [Escallonia herrerae]